MKRTPDFFFGTSANEDSENQCAVRAFTRVRFRAHVFVPLFRSPLCQGPSVSHSPHLSFLSPSCPPPFIPPLCLSQLALGLSPGGLSALEHRCRHQCWRAAASPVLLACSLVGGGKKICINSGFLFISSPVSFLSYSSLISLLNYLHPFFHYLAHRTARAANDPFALDIRFS